jgi:hypothetical protein
MWLDDPGCADEEVRMSDELRFVHERGNERFEIIEACGQGFYVWRYVDGVNTHDYLAPTLTGVFGTADDEWRVRESAWRPAIDGEIPLFEQ